MRFRTDFWEAGLFWGPLFGVQDRFFWDPGQFYGIHGTFMGSSPVFWDPGHFYGIQGAFMGSGPVFWDPGLFYGIQPSFCRIQGRFLGCIPLPSPNHDPVTPLFPPNPTTNPKSPPPSSPPFFWWVFFRELFPKIPIFHRFIHALFAYPGNPEDFPGGSQTPRVFRIFPRGFSVDSAPPEPFPGFFFFFSGIFPGFFRDLHPRGALA